MCMGEGSIDATDPLIGPIRTLLSGHSDIRTFEHFAATHFRALAGAGGWPAGCDGGPAE